MGRPSNKLNANVVRSMVKKNHPDARECPTSTQEQVLSFMVGMRTKESLCRFNIYLRTGTIGISKVFPSGQVREVFRRHVSSPEALEKVLDDPPKFSLLDYEEQTASQDLTAKIELAEVGVCILMGEREKLQSHLQSLEEKDDDDDVDDEEEDSTNELTGTEFDFSFHEDVVAETEQCLQDISDMGKRVTSVTTNGKGCVFLFGHGGVAYTPHIPKQLYTKLKALDARSSRPSYVAIGSRERYYVAFHNGTSDWKGPKSFSNCIKRAPRGKPRCVAFGSTYDTYFIVHNDGSWEYQGRGVPNDLIENLQEGEPDLVCVTLGPRGEWFMRTESGRLWWGGISEDLDDLIQNLLGSEGQERYLNFLDFGDDGSYFVSYD